MKAAILALLALVVAARVSAQQVQENRLRSADPAVVRAVDSALAQAAARGLPGEPLIQKAIEGTAKGAPPERVVAAVGVLLARLETASGALRAGGITSPAPAAIQAGAFALEFAPEIFDGRFAKGRAIHGCKEEGRRRRGQRSNARLQRR